MSPSKPTHRCTGLIRLARPALLWLLSVRSPVLALLLSEIGEGVEIQSAHPVREVRAR